MHKRRANCSGGRSPALRQLLDTARVELCQRVTYAPTAMSRSGAISASGTRTKARVKS